jgi:hypothetical protein
MYATQKNQLRRLSKQEFNALSALCRLSKNLYNVALYECRQYFFKALISSTTSETLNFSLPKINKESSLLQINKQDSTSGVITASETI